MKKLRLPAILLAAILQFLPLCRQLCTPPAINSAFAIVCRWIVGGAIALESVDAVSGASQFMFTCSNGATGYVGQPFTFMITVTNYGGDPGATIACLPVPAGLTNYYVDKVTTNPKQLYGVLTGTPTVATNNMRVTVVAGHPCCSSVFTNIYLTFLTGSPPLITNQPPVSQTVTAGGTANFTVGASGSGPLAYQWRRAGINLPGATGSALTLTGVRTNQAGVYTVVVGNAVTSNPSLLNVTVPPAPRVYYAVPAPGVFTLTFNPVAGLTNSVQTSSTAGPNGWGVLTNIPPPPDTNAMTITNLISGAQRYYRVSFAP